MENNGEMQNPVPQPAVEPAPKKKKTGLIAAIIALVVVALGCAVAAVVLLDPFHWRTDDRVPKAVAALFAQDAPTNVAINGVVSMMNNDAESAIAGVDIDFRTQLNTESMVNVTTADVTVTFADETDFAFKAEEVRVANGDFYLKLADVTKSIDRYLSKEARSLAEAGIDRATAVLNGTTETVELGEVLDCIDAGTDEDCVETLVAPVETITYMTLLDSMGIFDVIDGEWIRIPTSGFSNVTNLTQIDGPTQCVVDAMNTLPEYGKNIGNSYSANQFITYSTDNLSIASNGGHLYRLGVDEDKFVSFVNSLGNSGFANELKACVGARATNTTVTKNGLTDVFKSIPTMYVEINDSLQFTRVYLRATSEDGKMTAVADLALSYPASITVNEPTEYIELSSVLSQVLSTFYGGLIEETE